MGRALELARLDSGEAPVQSEPVDVARLVRDVLRHRDWLERVDLAMSSGRLTTLTTDPRRLAVVIANLLGNALDHGEPPVAIRVLDRPMTLEIEVRDHGPGIPVEHRAKVFDRFHKVDAARTRGRGSGLGLAIARDNARLLGGEVVVDSSVAEGTVMRVVLPHVPPPDDVAAGIGEIQP